MSAMKYNLTLVGVNKMSPALTGAAADAGDLTSVLRKQEKEARKLNATQRDLGRYVKLKENMAATSVQLRKTRSDMRGLAAQQEVSKSKSKGLSLEKRRLTRRLKSLSEEMEQGGDRAAELDAEYQQLRKEVDAVGVELDREQKKRKQLGKEYRAAQRDAGNLSNALADQRSVLRNLGGGLKDAGVDVSNLTSEQKRLAAATDKSTAAIDDQKNKLKTLGAARSRAANADARLSEAQGEIAGVAAMAATAAVPIARSITMDSAMGDVTKVVDFEGGEKEKFQSDLLKLAVEVNLPPEQLTQIAASGGQSGIAKGELLAFTASAARMGVAFDLTAEQAGEVMTGWRAGMNLNQEQAERLADAVNHLSNDSEGVVTAAKISEVLKRSGSDAVGTAGLTPVQAASLASAMLSGGAEADVVGTGMKNLLGALTKGWAATGTQKTAMERVGLDPETVAYQMQQDAVGTIQEVLRAINYADEVDQSALVSSIFGEEGKGMFVSLLKNPELLEKTFAQTANEDEYKGSYVEEFENQTKKTAFKLGAATKAFDRLGQTLTSDFLPGINAAADATAWVVNKLADLAEEGGRVTNVLTLGAAGFVAYKAASLARRLWQAKLEQRRANSAVSAAEKEVRLAAATDRTADKAGLAARAVDRFNDVLSRTARIRGGAADYDPPDRPESDKDKSQRSQSDSESGRDTKKGKARRSRRRGRFGRLLGGVTNGLAAVRDKVRPARGNADSPGAASRALGIAKNTAIYGGGGAALMALPGTASAAAGVELTAAMDLMGNVTGPLSDLAGGVGGLALQVVRPVDALMQSRNLLSAATEGSAADVGGVVGDIAGGTGGAMLGAAIGTAILPGIGTAVGGVIGGYLGGEGGGWLGETVGAWFDDDEPILERVAKSSPEPLGAGLKAADQSVKRVPVQSNTNQQITFSPQITVNAPPDANADQVAELAMQKLQAMFDGRVLPALNLALPGRLDDSMEIMG